MKKINIIIISIILITFIKFSSICIINQNFITKYNNGEYNEKSLSFNEFLNFFQSYVVYYNKGNAFYKNNYYEEAISEYNKALNCNSPKYKECKIRINLVLAMIKNIEGKDQVTVDEILEVLEKSKDILCEEGCADYNNEEGHSQDASQLKKDIEEYEKELKKQQKDNKNNKDENKEEKQQKAEEKQKKEEQIKQKQSQSNSSRQNKIESSNDSRNHEYYKGKKW